MKKERGFLLVAVLLITVILLIGGMALLTKQSTLYGEGGQVMETAQARSLAWTGLNDAMAKLEKDILFPPERADDQLEFSWSETVTDFTNSEDVGDYSVQLDLRYTEPPYSTIQITSTGRVGGADNPRATKTLVAEIDVRGNPSSNANYYQIVNFRER
jgi:hypothetical protein